MQINKKEELAELPLILGTPDMGNERTLTAQQQHKQTMMSLRQPIVS